MPLVENTRFSGFDYLIVIFLEATCDDNLQDLQDVQVTKVYFIDKFFCSRG